MAEDLPAPKSRKEEYLATAAGMTGIELPEPASREEIYLDAIAKGGGGGGGSSYTAGDGIDITSDVISVDTDTIQPKLTAGTNITIDEDNVISAEGGGATVVQTTGDSTTDVMSQKAVTDMIFYDNNTTHIRIGYNAQASGTFPAVAIGSNSKATKSSTTAIGPDAQATASDSIAIGSGAQSSQQYSIAIGTSITSTGATSSVGIAGQPWSDHCVAIKGNPRQRGSVAIGEGSVATSQGEFNIGSNDSTNYGYNNSNYRLLTGLYDGQSAHDAVTVEQVNATIDAINTALSTSIPHIGA